MISINNYILEKLHLNKDTKAPKRILLEAKNQYVYEQCEDKYEYIETDQFEFKKLYLISETEAEKIIDRTNKSCYCMYEWPTIFDNEVELKKAFDDRELFKKNLNIYQEYIDKGKI